MSDEQSTENAAKNGLVSVVMPLFNAAHTIDKSINSVLEQTYTNLELIIVDDCSTDDGVARVLKLASKDKRIKLIRLQTNSGAGKARNIAIKAANGRYISFLDADDKWFRNKLEVQIKTFAETKSALICSGYTVVDAEYNRIGEKIAQREISYNDLVKQNLIGCLTAIYDIEKTGKVYMPEIRKRQDYALWLSIVRKHGAAHCIQEILAEYYVQPKSISSNKLAMLKWNYRMFNETQSMSPAIAAFYTIRNAYYKIKNG